MSFMALYLAQEKWEKAVEYGDLFIRLHHEILDHKLPFVAECEQCKLLHREYNWQDAAQMVLLNPGSDSLVQLSAEWVLNNKATAMELLSERARLARGQTDLSVMQKWDRLGQVRDQLARAGFVGLTKSEQVQGLLDEERELSREIGRLIYADGRQRSWTKMDDVRAAVPSDGVLVEILRVKRKDILTEKSRGERYVAWVIPPRGKEKVQAFDLGSADTIDDDIRAIRRQIADTERLLVNEGEADAEKEMRTALAGLARKVITPLESILRDKRRWLISPDGALWLVPWQALPAADGDYAIRSHDIRLLTTGRDLLRRKIDKAKGPAVILGDPDYDFLPGTNALALVKRPYEERLTRSGFGFRSGDIASLSWDRLTGVRDEVAAMLPLIAKYTGTAPKVYAGTAATESVFKTLRQPRLVVLATHGFFLRAPTETDRPSANAHKPVPTGRSDLELIVPTGARVWTNDILEPERWKRYLVKEGEPYDVTVRIRLTDGRETLRQIVLKSGAYTRIVFGVSEATAVASHLENPLIRCGLALAGANMRGRLPPDIADDGILTGLEIVGTDLRGTELVVLSACETGVGDVRNAEGVAGLRQAFQLAGAERVVASLWRVPDQETTALMIAFWHNMAAGLDSADSLCIAQRTILEARRKTGKAAHPYFWAAFSVTGP